MFPQSLTKAVRPAARLTIRSRAAFTTSTRVMAGGDTGAPPKTGGQGDAFQKREKANEDFAIKQREKEKLMELKKKLADQQHHLKKLEDSIDEITKNQGGEHK